MVTRSIDLTGDWEKIDVQQPCTLFNEKTYNTIALIIKGDDGNPPDDSIEPAKLEYDDAPLAYEPEPGEVLWARAYTGDEAVLVLA